MHRSARFACYLRDAVPGAKIHPEVQGVPRTIVRMSGASYALLRAQSASLPEDRQRYGIIAVADRATQCLI